jgi:hypothetical protein
MAWFGEDPGASKITRQDPGFVTCEPVRRPEAVTKNE